MTNRIHVPFNRPCVLGTEHEYLAQALSSPHLSGDGPFSKKCQQWLHERIGCHLALLTPSCTHSLEMAALLLDIKPGDEVIMPSFTFVSTANAFAMRGATIVFVDIRPDTLNIDETLIEAAITSRTRAIVPVHYAGVACEMDRILEIANTHGLVVIEDAAQCIGSSYKGQALGGIGHMGALSFHETKNVTSGGEGGALLINDPRFAERAEIIREKGTNRSQFFRGHVDKYTWVDIGSSYLPSELQSAYLLAQLEGLERINQYRLGIWNYYLDSLRSLSPSVRLPEIPESCSHNGHIFHLRVESLKLRSSLLQRLKLSGVHAIFHYIPLHSAPGAQGRSRLSGSDRYTTRESETLLRLPLWHGIDEHQRDHVVRSLSECLM